MTVKFLPSTTERNLALSNLFLSLSCFSLGSLSLPRVPLAKKVIGEIVTLRGRTKRVSLSISRRACEREESEKKEIVFFFQKANSEG